MVLSLSSLSLQTWFLFRTIPALVLLLSSKSKTLVNASAFAYFMEELDSASRFSVEEPLMLSAKPGFEVCIDIPASSAAISVDQKAIVHVSIVSNLSIPLTMDRIAVRLVSRGSASRPSKPLVLEAVDVDLVPGKNSLSLAANATKGKFKLENCILQLGQVVFGHEYPGAWQHVVVRSSPLTADIEITVPDTILFDNTQHVQVEILSTKDIMSSIVFQAKATQQQSPLRFFQTPVVHAWKTSGELREELQLSLNGKDEISLPDLSPGQRWTVFIPCFAPSPCPAVVNDASTNFFASQSANYEVEFTLEYRTLGREKKVISKIFDLSFTHPFEGKVYAVPLLHTKRYLVCSSLRSRSSIPLQLRDYAISPSAGVVVTTDFGCGSTPGSPNASTIGTVLRTKETLSLAFEVELAGTEKSDFELQFNARFLLRDRQIIELEKFGLSSIVQASMVFCLNLKRPCITVSVSHPGVGVVGVGEEFRFTLLPNELVGKQAIGLFCVCYDEDCWAYAGRKQGSLLFDSETGFAATLIALRGGSLPLPHIRLTNFSPSVDVTHCYSSDCFVARNSPQSLHLLRQQDEAAPSLS